VTNSSSTLASEFFIKWPFYTPGMTCLLDKYRFIAVYRYKSEMTIFRQSDRFSTNYRLTIVDSLV